MATHCHTTESALYATALRAGMVWKFCCSCFKVRVKLRNFADLDFDLDPNWGITPKIETLYRNVAHI